METAQDTLLEEVNWSSEKYFQKILEPKEFSNLKILVEDSNGVISWNDFSKPWVIKIKNRKVDEIIWKQAIIFDKCPIQSVLKKLRKIKIVFGNIMLISVNKLEDLGDLEKIEWWFVLSSTKIKSLWNLKFIGGRLVIKNEKTLESLGNLEKIKGILTLDRVNIKTLWKLKIVYNDVIIHRAEKLEDLWNLEEIVWSFHLFNTSVRNLWKLKKVYGNLVIGDELDNLGNLEEVGWEISLEWQSVELQLQVFKKIRLWQLKVGTLVLDKGLKELFIRCYDIDKINLDKVRKIFWEDISKIESKPLKYWIKKILYYEYNDKKKEIKIKGEKLINDNKSKELNDLKKEELRNKFKSWGDELVLMKKKIEKLWIVINE